MAMMGSAPLALHFPESAEVPESTRHFELRSLIYDFLTLAFGNVAIIGCDQFVYWDPTNPRACLSPDAFLRFGARDEHFRSWKVWERGVPEVAVEIVSDSDASELTWEEKLGRYCHLGVSELVWFDPERPDQPLRIWDNVAGELLERRLLGHAARSVHLNGYWLPVAEPDGGLTLRLSRDERGATLFPTAAEHHAQCLRIEAEARRTEAEAHRAAEEALRLEMQARRAAEQRIIDLEAELKRKS
jgi:Uma2 family endonuclease